MLEIRRIQQRDIDLVSEAFGIHGIEKSKNYINKCWQENQRGERITLLAFYHGEFAGSLHLLTKSGYPHFRDNKIPEINDFNVIPIYRKHGIGNALMDAIEKIAFETYGIVGIGVGLYASYASAQRMYAKRGYIPDGRGLMYNGLPAKPGTMVCVDDDLNLFYTKKA